MAGMDWFRWHHGSVTDPKFQLVARKSGSSVAEVIGVWATLLEAASMADERGCHGVLDFEALDCSLGLDEGKAHQIYALMTVRGLVDADSQSICAWFKRQPLREREDAGASDRKQAQRERDKNKSPQVTPKTEDENHVTPCHTKKSLEEIRGEEIREEDKTHTAAIVEDNAPETVAGVSVQAAVCMVIKSEGIGSVNPQHPELLALIGQGAEVGQFAQAARLARSKNKGFAYLLGVVKGQMADAKNLAEGAGCSPGTGTKPRTAVESFHERDARIGRERWEQMTGEVHPENQPFSLQNVIDSTVKVLEISQ